MANTNTRKDTTRKPSGNTRQTQKPVETKKSIIPKDIDPTQYITVRNGFQGQLVYKSQRSGELFTWEGFGDEQDIELRELRSMKNSSKTFFINNWFMFNDDDDWVIDYLGVRQYYKNALKIDNFDDIFTKKPTELKAIISKLSDGQKRSVAYRASQLIVDQQIDSLSVISTLEEALGIELIEK